MLSRFLSNRNDLSRGDDPFAHLQREIGRVVEDTFGRVPALRGSFGGFAPSLDVKETPEGLELTAELPGVKEDAIELSLEGELLTLAGEKHEERKTEEKGVHLQERSYGRFQRSLRLPFAPESGSVAARFENGVLHVTLPKPAQQSAAANRIPIRAGGAPKAEGQAQAGQAPGSQAPQTPG